jgi:DNA invertase Pin-like site-specific DNA recombinase
MPKAYSYIRFSSGKQAKGDSLKRQSELRDAYLARNEGLELDQTLKLSDLGVSAWKGSNAATGALSQFLKLAEAGKIPRGSVLIVEHLDRLSREHVRKALTLFLGILETGITIVTLEPERTYSPESTDQLPIIEALVMFAAANEKVETLSSRLKARWKTKRELRKPMTSWCPAWIELKDGKYKLIPENARIIRQIVELALNGYGDKRLVKKLNQDKVKVISGHKIWTNAYVSKILKSISLIGQYEPTENGKPTGEVWDDYYPRVISDDDFSRLRAARKMRYHLRGRFKQSVQNLFTEICINAKDKQPFHRIVKDRPRLLSAAYRNGIPGDMTSFDYETFEKAFLYMIRQIDIGSLYDSAIDKPEIRLELLVAERINVNAKIEEIQNELATGEFKSLMPVLRKLELRQTALNVAIEEEQSRQSNHELDAITDIKALLNSLAKIKGDPQDGRTRLRGRIRQLVKEIYVYIHGGVRARTKTAQVQVYFHGGGIVEYFVHCAKGAKVLVELSGKEITESEDIRDVEKAKEYLEKCSKRYTAQLT